MTEIVIARHGETTWNAEGRFQGHADVPLNARGREQAAGLAARLAESERFAAIHASDLVRAFETATIVAERLGLVPVPEHGLREIDVGAWSGLTRPEIERTWPGAIERWAAGGELPDGETRAELAARVKRAALAIAADHPGSRVLLVAHGGVIRSLQRLALGAPEPVVENCAAWEFAVEAGRLTPATF
jgi:broad specificity phosphatase PhoE